MAAKSALRLFGRIAIVACSSVVLAAAGVLLFLPPLTGSTSLSVLSGSMEPTMPRGSVAFVRSVEPSEIRVGDIITYSPSASGALTSHRVVDVTLTPEGSLFETKGDANEDPDAEPTHEDAVHGRVWWHIPFLGRARDAAGTPRGMATVGGAILLLVIGDRLRQRRSRSQTADVSRNSRRFRPLHRLRGERERRDLPVSSDLTFATRNPLGGEVDSRSDQVSLPDMWTHHKSSILPPATPSGKQEVLQRQLLLARIQLDPAARGDVLGLLNAVGAAVVAVAPRQLVFQFVDSPKQIEALRGLLLPHGILKECRSSAVSLRVTDEPTTEHGEGSGPPAASALGTRLGAVGGAS